MAGDTGMRLRTLRTALRSKLSSREGLAHSAEARIVRARMTGAADAYRDALNLDVSV